MILEFLLRIIFLVLVTQGLIVTAIIFGSWLYFSPVTFLKASAIVGAIWVLYKAKEHYAG